jgi:hypothetical protein
MLHTRPAPDPFDFAASQGDTFAAMQGETFAGKVTLLGRKVTLSARKVTVFARAAANLVTPVNTSA